MEQLIGCTQKSSCRTCLGGRHLVRGGTRKDRTRFRFQDRPEVSTINGVFVLLSSVFLVRLGSGKNIKGTNPSFSTQNDNTFSLSFISVCFSILLCQDGGSMSKGGW